MTISTKRSTIHQHISLNINKCHDIQIKIIKTWVSFSEAIPINYKTHTHYEITNIFTVVN